MQADLQKAQGSERAQRQQVTVLTTEVKKKDDQLAELTKATQQLEVQLATAKTQADKATADVQAKSQQLSSVQASLAAQQAANQPTAVPVQSSAPTSQVCCWLSCCLTAIIEYGLECCCDPAPA